MDKFDRQRAPTISEDGLQPNSPARLSSLLLASLLFLGAQHHCVTVFMSSGLTLSLIERCSSLQSLHFLWSKGVQASSPYTFSDRKVFMPPVLTLSLIERCSCHRSLHFLWSKGVHATGPYTFSDRKVFKPPVLTLSLIERCSSLQSLHFLWSKGVHVGLNEHSGHSARCVHEGDNFRQSLVFQSGHCVICFRLFSQIN